ncbi:MAG: FecR domain-containing protein [Anaerolineae bacterium]|nr:FecR domain-containing protein [Anaerolineae bacterium]
MKYVRVILFVILFLSVNSIYGQTDFAATLEVLAPTVSVQRVNTSNPIEVSVEAIVGVGDVITTGEDGRARITFFADGTTTELEPNTSYRIDEFNGTDASFTLRVSVLIGQTTQQLGRTLDSNSTYEIDTPGMTLGARGTIFAIRVEESGRAGMLVREGNVVASTEESSADVPPDFGIRAEAAGTLSDVVRATTFDQLDSALDGCAIQVSTIDDVSINVRLGPSLEAQQIGFIPSSDIVLAMGRSESGDWYRFEYGGNFGWFLSSSASVEGACSGLRVFPDDYQENSDGFTDTIETTPDAEATEEAGG